MIQGVMEKNPPVRYGGALASTRMKAWQDAGLQPGFGNDRFRVSAIKAWSDGFKSRPHWLSAPTLSELGQPRRSELHA